MRQGVGHGANEHSRARAICLGADDFGLHAGIDEAVLSLVRQARVHAVGCMVGAPAWRDGAVELRRLPEAELDVGLHLDLTEHPLLPGSRSSLRGLVLGSGLRSLDAAALRREIRAQLDAFEHGLGRGPAFVDGHQHVHQLPVVRAALMAELGGRYAGREPWLRSTRAGRTAAVHDAPGWRARVKPRVIEALGQRGLAALARGTAHRQNRHLLGVYDFQGGADRYRRLLAGWLRSAVDGDLLMCHPGCRLPADVPIAGAREAEYEVLGSAAFAAMLRHEALALMPMSRILARRAR